jgi:probable HAF family extracellular repeat protein
MQRLFQALLVVTALGYSEALSDAQPFYTITDLGSLGGQFSEATDINSAGHVIGGAATPSGLWHAFLYSNGVLTDIHPGGEQSVATSINNRGQVLEWSAEGSARSYFLFQGGKSSVIQGYWPTVINDTGQVAGDAPDPSGIRHAYLVTDGQATEVSPRGKIGTASAINNLGHVVGISYEPTSGFVFDGKQTITCPSCRGRGNSARSYQ